VPASATPIQKKRNKIAKIFDAGFVVFATIMGFITALASFLAHLKLT